MTDNAFINSNIWLPNDVWEAIARFLDNQDLAQFRQLCKVTNGVGSDVVVLQPLYNRLYAMDKSLPAALPQEGALAAFQYAVEKIQARQQFEMAYLTKHHPDLRATADLTKVFQENTPVSLQSLEAKHEALDKMNSEIIQPKIDVNRTELDLNNAHITRLPVSLFQAEGYVHFWQNLTHLFCSRNQLATLDLQGLLALQTLWCDHNQLTTLNVQGLAALQTLWCSNNQLTTLNVQGLALLQQLYCQDNQLTTLNVQGLAALQDLWCDANQLTTLNLQGLAALGGLVCGNNQLTALDLQGLVALQMLVCGHNQLTTLDVRGLAALQTLYCNNNPLSDLNLTGAHASIKTQHAEQERSLLFKQLSQADSDEIRQGIIDRLGADYTYANCLYYCPVYAAKLLAFDSANSAYDLVSNTLSRASAFLPTFSELKRKREEAPEASEDEPEGKRPKKK